MRILRAIPREGGPAADMRGSPTYPRLVEHFRQGEDVPLTGHTHFIPMEAPGLVAQHVLELLALERP